MITVLRNYFKQGSQVVLWIVMGAFVVGLLPMAFRSASQSSVWAIRVNGQTIGYKEYLFEEAQQRERMLLFRQQYGEYADFILSMMGMDNPKVVAQQYLVRQMLANQFAHKVGINVGSDYISNKIVDPEFVSQQLGGIIPPQLIDPLSGINHEMLARYLKLSGLSVELFEQQIERALVNKVVMDLIGSMVYVPQFDIKQKYQSEHAEKSYELITLALSDFVKKEKEQIVSSEELAKFYEEQNNATKRYWVPEKRSGQMWTFDASSYGIVIPEEKVVQYYEDNKLKKFIEKPSMVEVRTILITVPHAAQKAERQREAARIKDELLQDPSQFATIARQVSQDKESAAQGGLLKPFARGTHEAVFDRAAFLLAEDGALSDVIETSRGLEILQRVSKTPQVYKSLESVKSDIKNELTQKEFARKFVADIKAIASNDETLADFIQKKGGKAKRLENVLSEENAQLFKLKEGEKSFFVDGLEGVALKLDTISSSYKPSLEAIKNIVLDDIYKQKAKQALQKSIAELKKSAGSQELKKLAKDAKGHYTKTGFIVPGDESVAQKYAIEGALLAEMLQMEKPGMAITHIQEDKGFVIKLDTIAPFDHEKYMEKRGEVVKNIEQQRLQQYQEAFVASLHRNARIETNESFITLQ